LALVFWMLTARLALKGEVITCCDISIC